MEASERTEARASFLRDAAELLAAHLASSEWGRLLVELRAIEGSFRVAGVDVDEIVGDERLVEAAFGAPTMQEILPVLAKLTEALVVLGDGDPNAVGGGTFVRQPEGGFEFLLGRVRVPSAAIDASRGALRAWADRSLLDQFAALGVRSDSRPRVAFDLEQSLVNFTWADGGALRGRATAIASFARAPVMFAWASSNPRLADPIRARASQLLDRITARDAWEITTPHFQTDEPTALLIASLAAQLAGAKALHVATQTDGTLFFAVSDLERATPIDPRT